MIPPGTRFEGPVRVPLTRIVVTEFQPRYPERLLHYVRLLSDPAYADHDAGIVMLTPLGDADAASGLLTILDGHHRFLSAVIAGRSDILALIQHPPVESPDPQPDPERERPVLTLRLPILASTDAVNE